MERNIQKLNQGVKEVQELLTQTRELNSKMEQLVKLDKLLTNLECSAGLLPLDEQL